MIRELTLASAILGGGMVIEDRYNNQDEFVKEQEKVSSDLIALNGYIEQRMADQRITYLNQQLAIIMHKARFFPLTDYDKKQIEYLNFLIQQEKANARNRGLRY